MRVRFQIINHPETYYSAELTENVKGSGLNAVIVRDLNIKPYEDVEGAFKSLMLRQVVTLVIDGRNIDFYKTLGGSGADISLSTHP